MIQRLPAWGTTLGKRIAAYPEVHVIDSGLAAGCSGSALRRSAAATPLC